MKLPRGIFVVRGRIPGIRGENEDSLITPRTKPGLDAHKARATRRLGRRTRSKVSEEAELRAYGVGVFDRNAGSSELGGYLNPRD